MKNKEKLVSGFGINDADYVVQKFENGKMVWVCPFYAKWRGMINRCYHKRKVELSPMYENVYVCNEWAKFTNFKAWMEKQDWQDKHLDKDLLCFGKPDKYYSPDTCLFVTRQVNMFITERQALRGSWPIGVDFVKKKNKYRARCSNPFTGGTVNIGDFPNPEEAHNAWLNYKLNFARMIAAQTDDRRVAEALVARYESYGRMDLQGKTTQGRMDEQKQTKLDNLRTEA